MSKYFTYKTVDELRADIERLGVEIPLEEHLEHVWRSVRIGHLTMGNSLAIHPMEGCDATPDGRPDELTFRRWRRFAQGGAKLIWGEATAVVEEGRANTRQLWLNEANEKDFELLVERTRKAHREEFGKDNDLLIGLQLTHSGRWCYRKPMIIQHNPALDKITYLDKKKGVLMPEDYPVISDDYLERLEDAYVKAAKRAFKIGFQFVDIKMCHGYLLNELLGARLRTGKYGGGFQNRTRLVSNVIRKIRAEVGEPLVLASRISGYDGIPFHADSETGKGIPWECETPYVFGFGIDQLHLERENLEEPKRLIGLLHQLGVQMVSVTMGSPYHSPHIGRPFEKPPVDAYEPPEHPLIGVDRHFRVTTELQRAYPEMVVVGAGYSWLREYLLSAAEANLRLKRVSVVGLGRGAIAYPDFVKDAVKTGRLSQKKVCLSVSYCTTLMRLKHNKLGQFATGCVPRDSVYAEIYKESLRTGNP